VFHSLISYNTIYKTDLRLKFYNNLSYPSLSSLQICFVFNSITLMIEIFWKIHLMIYLNEYFFSEYILKLYSDFEIRWREWQNVREIQTNLTLQKKANDKLYKVLMKGKPIVLDSLSAKTKLRSEANTSNSVIPLAFVQNWFPYKCNYKTLKLQKYSKSSSAPNFSTKFDLDF
jgi:hypothetical protein